MRDLAPGVFTELFARLDAQVQVRAAAAIGVVGLEARDRAKKNAAEGGSHAYGTPTPASPGAGPASISGTLVASVALSGPSPFAGGWVCRIGPEPGHYPTYGSRASDTDSASYGYYLETGLRNGATYPWLRPAGTHAGTLAHAIFVREFTAGPWA